MVKIRVGYRLSFIYSDSDWYKKQYQTYTNLFCLFLQNI